MHFGSGNILTKKQIRLMAQRFVLQVNWLKILICELLNCVMKMRPKYCNKFLHILLMAKIAGYFPPLVIQYNVLSFAAHYSRGINITVESFTAVTHNELF